MRHHLPHLKVLEAESIHIMREVVAECRKPAMLFSGGKDSILMLHLAAKAFYPGKVPFPLLHIDTEHNFPEAIEFRDRCVKKLGVELIVRSVQESIDKGRVSLRHENESRNAHQTVTLLDAIEELKFDALFGGGRRDEEKARAKERIFSFRDEFGQWDPKNQRPELWQIYNTYTHADEHMRVFPISNWTELDVWITIALERIEIPSLYYAHEREVLWRDGCWLAKSPLVSCKKGEKFERKSVRFRTVGDMSCTAAVESKATTLEEIVKEITATRITERGATRMDDKTDETSMEKRKREGYF